MDGMRRVPWRLSLDEPGPGRSRVGAVAPVLDERQPDQGGPAARQPAAGAAGRGGGAPVGVVVLESLTDDEFTAAAVEELGAVVQAPVCRSRPPRSSTSCACRPPPRSVSGWRGRCTTASRRTSPIWLRARRPALRAAQERRRRLRRAGARAAPADHRADLELRLSISDLRSSVGPARGLGAALTEYARSVGTSTGMTVHLELSEGAVRLPADTEVQLLRIAHEAMGSARRRRGARNLWVTLVIDPPVGRW
jgi:hypothetical protein